MLIKNWEYTKNLMEVKITIKRIMKIEFIIHTIESTIIHLGMNPSKGGIPPRLRSRIREDKFLFLNSFGLFLLKLLIRRKIIQIITE